MTKKTKGGKKYRTFLSRTFYNYNDALAQARCDRFTHVTHCDGTTKNIRLLDGQLIVCKGCCCGNTEKGNPPVPLEEFKAQWCKRKLRSRVHLTVSGCLGPCPLANVVLILIDGQVIWLHSINTSAHVTAIYDYLEEVLQAGAYVPLTGLLAACRFQRFEYDAVSQVQNSYPNS
jgi:cobaltochelatase CobN